MQTGPSFDVNIHRNCYTIYATNDIITPAHQDLTDLHPEDLRRILHGMHSGPLDVLVSKIVVAQRR